MKIRFFSLITKIRSFIISIFEYVEDNIIDRWSSFWEFIGVVLYLFPLWLLIYFHFFYNKDQNTSYYDLGRKYYDLKYFDKAVYYYNLSELIEFEKSRSRGDLFFERGMAKVCNGDTIGAKIDFELAIKQDTSMVLVYFDSSVDREADFCKCPYFELAIFDYAVNLYPNSYKTYFARAKANMVSGDLIRALDDIDRAIKIDTAVTKLYLTRAEINLKLGKKENAISDYSKIVDIHPKNSNALCRRAIVRMEIGDTIGGCVDLLKIRDAELRDSIENMLDKYCSN
jgi:tetratricopeptide (TPR) repeat protein